MKVPSWVVHALHLTDNERATYYAMRTSPLSADETFFMKNQARAISVVEVTNPNACYDYDDWALAQIDNEFFVFNTSGCSCPSPEETWYLAHRGDLESTLHYLVIASTPAPTYDPRSEGGGFGELLRALTVLGWKLNSPAPAAPAASDW